MRILVDTNIFIQREDPRIVPQNLQLLLRTLNEMSVQILIHPLSIKDVERDRDPTRKSIILSKIKTYPVLSDPPTIGDDGVFDNAVGRVRNVHDVVDHDLLYAVYKDAIELLVTEDKGIEAKSKKLGISDRVLAIDEALTYFSAHVVKQGVSAPPAIAHIPVYSLDLGDPIFDSLRRSYSGFEDWWADISREGRKAWVYKDDGALGALLIHKIENEAIASTPALPAKRRLKICTLKVSYTGYKLGELFIKICIEFAVCNNIDEIYLTHIVQPTDYLAGLIEEFGFRKVARKGGEDVFLKRLLWDGSTIDPVTICRDFYPSFNDGPNVKKLLIPIRPEYHEKLFTDYRFRQPTLYESVGELIVEGNTIKKAYLSHSRIKGMSPGEVIMFYRSRDLKKITTLGVVEAVYDRVTDVNEIVRHVGKRTVYSRHELTDMVTKPTKVILFWQSFHLERPVSLISLREVGITLSPPQSITEVQDSTYREIKRRGGVDERFAVS